MLICLFSTAGKIHPEVTACFGNIIYRAICLQQKKLLHHVDFSGKPTIRAYWSPAFSSNLVILLMRDHLIMQTKAWKCNGLCKWHVQTSVIILSKAGKLYIQSIIRNPSIFSSIFDLMHGEEKTRFALTLGAIAGRVFVVVLFCFKLFWQWEDEAS